MQMVPINLEILDAGGGPSRPFSRSNVFASTATLAVEIHRGALHADNL